MVRRWPSWSAARLACTPQPADGVTYAAKIDKGETAHRLRAPRTRGPQPHSRAVAGARRLVRGRAPRRQARAHQGAAHDARGRVAAPRHRARRRAHRRLRRRARCASWSCSARASARCRPTSSCAAFRCRAGTGSGGRLGIAAIPAMARRRPRVARSRLPSEWSIACVLWPSAFAAGSACRRRLRRPRSAVTTRIETRPFYGATVTWRKACACSARCRRMTASSSIPPDAAPGHHRRRRRQAPHLLDGYRR